MSISSSILIDFLLLLLIYMSYLGILDKEALSDKGIADIFFHSVADVFIFLMIKNF